MEGINVKWWVRHREVGDVVKIRSDLEIGVYGIDTVVEKMLRFRGKTAKILGVIFFERRGNGSGYIYSLDLPYGEFESDWAWTEEMLE